MRTLTQLNKAKVLCMQKYLHIILIMSSCIILNACVAVIAAGGVAGKEFLPNSKSHQEVIPITTIKPQPAAANSATKVTPLVVAEKPLQTAPEQKKEVTQPKPVAQKTISSTEAIPANQLELLNKFPWTVKSAPSIPDVTNLKDNAFIFAANGIFSGFGGCNYFSGKFKANNQGDFLITTLKSSNEACSKNNDDETKLINALIMADQFKIQDNRLSLLSDELTLVSLDQSKEINIDELIQKSSNPKRPKQHKIKKLKTSKSTKINKAETKTNKTKPVKQKIRKAKVQAKANKTKK